MERKHLLMISSSPALSSFAQTTGIILVGSDVILHGKTVTDNSFSGCYRVRKGRGTEEGKGGQIHGDGRRCVREGALLTGPPFSWAALWHCLQRAVHRLGREVCCGYSSPSSVPGPGLSNHEHPHRDRVQSVCRKQQHQKGHLVNAI